MAMKWTSLFHISIWLLAGQVSCGAIGAWWNDRGPNFIIQNDDTGGIQYSFCNGNYTPIFPDDSTLTISFTQYQPKNQTSLSATGWMDGETTWASIFYLDNSDEIVNAVLRCDWNTGHWQNTGEYIISIGSPKVGPRTGIAAVLLGSAKGYRIFYNDIVGNLQEIGYTAATTWKYYGIVSHDVVSAQAVGATFSGETNITVVRPRDEGNMGVSRWYTDNTWHISTFPEPLTWATNATNATEASDLTLNTSSQTFELPAWVGNASSLAVGVDRAYTRSIYYIGADRNVYHVGNQNYTWKAFDRPSPTAFSSSGGGGSDAAAWPLADTPGGALGLASSASANITRLYYVSGGRVVEAVGDSGVWRAPAFLETVNATQALLDANGNPGGELPAKNSSGGMSDGAKVGVSVGVSLGVVAVGGSVFVLWLLRRRQRRVDEDEAAAAAAAKAKAQTQTPPDEGYAAGAQQPGYYYSPEQQQFQFQQQQQQSELHANSAYSPSQQGGWAYTAPLTATDSEGRVHQLPQGYYYYNENNNNHDNGSSSQASPQSQQWQWQQQRPPAEMMGEGHYKEAP
ncbi:uncharacterized protein GGS25DRAFT_524235 [Hypoxylon fragiforme]|uniref:uncharacterized protein n=1 Tax=Hypoxylon fragiforme TaxID=63214 RepID=UPI0020C5C441|nr:uncharacterized protein GGS25DRAFT_524235 [Hypoxylon fragiforme]KAI2604742.1 hypothetical protein GGS25DRAFT_524235 [Hypoxylon fragiforme]